jgi:hypothetical protein
MGPVPAMRGTTEGAAIGGGFRRDAEGGGRAAAQRGGQDEYEGRRHVVVLTLEGGQLISVRAYDGSELTVVSQAAAERYGVDRATLQTPLMLEGPSGTPTLATQVCTMVFPLEGPQGRKLEIYTLEEYCGVHQNSMWKWQVQLGIEEDEILPWLQVAQPGDRHWGELTMDRVTGYFYRLPPSLPRYRERWKGRKRHWNNNKKWCHQLCSPRLLALLQPAQAERHR